MISSLLIYQGGNFMAKYETKI
ncbi:MAG: hypothetical protein PWQ85_62, partial [Geotoga sp.]|nr:hypothetical protein [Geotoga sp.]